MKMFLLLALCATCLPVALSVPGVPEMRLIEDHSGRTPWVKVWTFTLDEEYISMFVESSNGVLVIEPVRVDHSTEMLKAIRNVTNKPIRYCIYSHNHWDHEGGGQVWRDVGATLVAHAEAIEYFKAPGNLREDVLMPDMSWDGTERGDKYEFMMDDVKFHLIYLGQSHGFGMSALYMPDQKIAYISDIVNPNRIMFVIVPEFNTQEWQESLRWIMNNLDFEKGVYTHNKKPDYLAAGNMTDVIEEHDFIVDMRNEITRMINAGTHPLMVPTTLRLPKYQHWALYNSTWLEMNVWRMVMERWMGPYPYRPNWPQWKPKPETAPTPVIRVECHVSSAMPVTTSFFAMIPLLLVVVWNVWAK